MEGKLLGVIKDTKNNVLGYRVFTIPAYGIRDINIGDIGTYLKDNTIDGETGKLSCKLKNMINMCNYTVLVNGMPRGTEYILILSRLVYKGNVVAYTIANCWGMVQTVTSDYLIHYGKDGGIINGSVQKNNMNSYELDVHGECNTVQLSNGGISTDNIGNIKRVVTSLRGNVDIVISDRYTTVKATYKPCSSKYVWVDSINTAPEHRENGLATSMYNKLEKYIIEHNISKEIRVGLTDTVDILFFKSVGFNVTEYTYDSVEKPESCIMAKSLNSIDRCK